MPIGHYLLFSSEGCIIFSGLRVIFHPSFPQSVALIVQSIIHPLKSDEQRSNTARRTKRDVNQQKIVPTRKFGRN